MSGKGCHLLVSPCNVSPSIRGHQSQTIRIPMSSAQLSPSPGMESVKRGAAHSLAPGKLSESHGVLQTLSLRRKVLTNGKQPAEPSASPHQQVPAHHTPTRTVTATIQTRFCTSSNSFKGKNKSHQLRARGQTQGRLFTLQHCSYKLRNLN